LVKEEHILRLYQSSSKGRDTCKCNTVIVLEFNQNNHLSGLKGLCITIRLSRPHLRWLSAGGTPEV